MTTETKFDIQRFAPDTIVGPVWYGYHDLSVPSDNGDELTWIYIAADTQVDVQDRIINGEENITIRIENASNVTGDDKNFTVTPAEGKTFADVKVTKNSTEHNLNITIGETVYSVNTDGTLAAPNAKPAATSDSAPKKSISIQIKSVTPEGKKASKTINYINPNAPDTDLASFAGTVTGLSQNTYKDTVYVEKEQVFSKAAETAAKKSPQLSVSPNPAEIISGSNATAAGSISRLGDGALSADTEIDGTTVRYTTRYATDVGTEAEITITVAETAEYASESVVWKVVTVQETSNPNHPNTPNTPENPEIEEPPVVEPEP